MSEKLPILIGFTGYYGAGKDTAIAAIRSIAADSVRLAFGDPVYASMLAINPVISWRGWFRKQPVRLQTLVDKLGWDKAKRTYPEIRRLLQAHGTAARAHWGTDFWIKQAFAKWQPDIPTFVSGVRHADEVEAIVERGGVVWRIDRPGLQQEAERSHLTEAAIDKIPHAMVDRWFVNNDRDLFDRDIKHAYLKYVTTRRKA